MGNLCGKESKDDHFSTPGRTLDSVPPPSNTRTSAVPVKISTGGGRTLGTGGSSQPQPSSEQDDARAKAREAAERRLNVSNRTKGSLGKKLQDQKKQTRNDTLDAASKDERRARDADSSAEARAYN
ncbi:hypothetical protein BJ878DRAFT_497604 [Calycina marina]|uniref:Uncharacterized protein n=1 Tax=Calycina marina TaxID=1763456 RepID=A0A9P7Z652_9HELO|nr:hypothetical protein BJ878DRAFT_497604 [Calycina marina]